LNDYTTYTSKDGGYDFRTKAINPNYEIRFAVQTNKLQFLPGETYTITWEYGFQCSATALINGTRTTVKGSGPLNAGFRSNAGSGIDAYSPKATYVNNVGELYSNDSKTAVKRHTFTFQADNIAATTNKEFRIEGKVVAPIKGGDAAFAWFFMAEALLKNFKVYRGDEEIANSQFIGVQYLVKEYSAVPIAERANHSIGAPSPPDDWFIKFSTAPGLFVGTPTTELVYIPIGGTDWPAIPSLPVTPTTPTIPDLPIDPPPPDPPDTDGGETIIISDDTTAEFATRLSRLLVTNQMDLHPNTLYRFHIIVNRVKSFNVDKVLKIRINPSLAALKPSFDGTVTSSGIQFPIEWVFTTAGIAAEDLLGIRFRIDLFEEDIDIDDAATVYVSDINILGKIIELPANTIYRYDGVAWDNAITQVSDDGGIVGGHPHSLIESYEAVSAARRLYCISDGNIYVWSSNVQDPYGSNVASRIVIAW
jgi:hypothetical protein